MQLLYMYMYSMSITEYIVTNLYVNMYLPWLLIPMILLAISEAHSPSVIPSWSFSLSYPTPHQ